MPDELVDKVTSLETGSPSDARVAVLLATRNGGRYLDTQLKSVAAQAVGHIDVYASDDASSDGTRAILAAWQGHWQKGRFDVLAGPAQGFAENFRGLMLARHAEADYFAYCDQDDIWDADKLTVAINVLAPFGDRAGLYCSRTRLVDTQGRTLGYSPLFSREPHFRNAIVQSIAGGNTMVLNKAGFALVAEAARRSAFVSHDWWSYQIVSGTGGRVFYDPVPHIGYRQHNANAVGNNLGFGARIRRIGMALEGRFRGWNETNVASLERCSDLLSDEARATLGAFRTARTASPLRALNLLRESGIYRQTTAGDVSLSVATLLGKL